MYQDRIKILTALLDHRCQADDLRPGTNNDHQFDLTVIFPGSDICFIDHLFVMVPGTTILCIRLLIRFRNSVLQRIAIIRPISIAISQSDADRRPIIVRNKYFNQEASLSSYMSMQFDLAFLIIKTVTISYR